MNDPERASRLDTSIASPRRALRRLAVPIMAGMLLPTIYMLADMFFVGRVSAPALAALASNMTLVCLLQ